MFYLIRLAPPPEGLAVICAILRAARLQNQSEVGEKKYSHTAALQLYGPIPMLQAILFYLHVPFKT